MRMLQHLSRQQLMTQLVRSVEQCQHERRAREGVKRAARWSEYLKVIAQKTEDDRGKTSWFDLHTSPSISRRVLPT
jgi:hypothetical protein